MRLSSRSYDQVESGRRTVEIRVDTPEWRAVQAGEVIVFHDAGGDREVDVVVDRVSAHGSLDALVDAYDPRRIDPDTATGAELLAALRALCPPAKEQLGVLAFEFGHRPGRAGRPMPMTPAAYVRTVRQHTAYGCLYVRDEHDRPVQLRSVYGGRQWQLPGGNTDTGEDPLGTARREAVEETGLALGLGPPRLLLTHYLHPGPGWPVGKIGFFFYGGTLTPEQLAHIRLDPGEHDLWAVHTLAEWRGLMGDGPFTRLRAVERARTDRAPGYLVTGPAGTP